MNKLLRIQKVLRFIPYINLLTIFPWPVLIIKHKVDSKVYLKQFLILIIIFILLNVPYMILSNSIENNTLNKIVYIVTGIIQFYFVSFYSVYNQEKILGARH